MGIRDRQIEWMREHVWVPASQFGSPLLALTLNEATPNTYLSHRFNGGGAGTPAHVELSTFSFTAIQLDAAGESVSYCLLLPFNMDPTYALKFRIHYTTESTTAADTFTWKGFYNNVKSAAALADPATAFSTDFGALNVLSGTAFRPGKTGWGEIAASTWTRAEVEAGHLVPVSFEIDASDATLSSEYCYFLGFEYTFMPRRTRGSPGAVRDADAVGV